jgi:hypothetical protein
LSMRRRYRRLAGEEPTVGMVTESRVQTGADAARGRLRCRDLEVTDQGPTLVGDDLLS